MYYLFSRNTNLDKKSGTYKVRFIQIFDESGYNQLINWLNQNAKYTKRYYLIADDKEKAFEIQMLKTTNKPSITQYKPFSGNLNNFISNPLSDLLFNGKIDSISKLNLRKLLKELKVYNWWLAGTFTEPNNFQAFVLARLVKYYGDIKNIETKCLNSDKFIYLCQTDITIENDKIANEVYKTLKSYGFNCYIDNHENSYTINNHIIVLSMQNGNN